MSMWIAIVAIVAITSVSKVMHSRYDAMSKIKAIQGGSAENATLTREIAALNSRIAVLERIVTDTRGSHSLAHQIDALRD